nr:IS3 family transposase [Sinosporangium album]
MDKAFAELEPVTSTKFACDTLGKSRSTLHRHRNPRPRPPGPHRPPAPHPAQLSPQERRAVIEALNSERFWDKAPAQVWAALLDEGVYLCSVRTMYRLLAGAGQTGDRRGQAAHPPRVRPELVADGPDQVWTWDITRLKGPVKGVYFDLYAMLDIFSRRVVHWEVRPTENGELAKRFIQGAVKANGGAAPRTIHADRGTSMTSKTVAQLLADMNIEQSHSRPRVSNDNPYSEANFKTLKYCPAFPERFGSIQHARQFCEEFFQYYNHEHYHSGIGLHTPASVHFGTAGRIRDERARVLAEAYARHPERFRRRPEPPPLPARAWINEPRPASIETTEDMQPSYAA